MNCKHLFFSFFILISCLFQGSVLFAQDYKIPVEVSLPAETEKFSRMTIDHSGVYVLQKDKTKEVTTKKFKLINYLSDFKTNWTQEVVIGQFENPLSFSLTQGILHFVTVFHNLDSLQTCVLNRKYSCKNGALLSQDTLLSYEVGEWLDAYGKASVAQTFESALSAKQAVNNVSPLEYRFNLDYSLDSSKVIIYQYDNSQDKLVIRGAVFNSAFELIDKFNLGVDDAHVCYGLKVDDRGEIYLLKISNTGRLAVLNVNLKTDQEKYLTLPKGSTDKVNPRLFIHKSHEVYLVYCNTKKDHLQSVSLATLNFDTEQVDDQHLYKLSAEFLLSLNTHIKNGDKYFELAEIEEVGDHLMVILEQHQIEGADIHYQPNDKESLAHWEPGNALVTTGNLLVLVFNKNLDPQGKFVIYKTQKGEQTDGMNTLSHKVFKYKNGLKFVYSNRTKGLTNNEFHLSFLDLKNMKMHDSVISSNSTGMVPVLTSTIFIPDGSLVYLTRKGILGRKNYLNKWHYSSR